MVGETLTDRLRLVVGQRSNRRVAELTGTHPETVRRYLQGQSPSVEFIARLGGVLGINADWILTGVGPMRKAENREAALRASDPSDLLWHVAQTIERLEDRVERLERYSQALEVLVRGGAGRTPPPPDEPEPETVDPKKPDPPQADAPRPQGTQERADHGTRPADEARARAEHIARAIPGRPRPDAR